MSTMNEQMNKKLKKGKSPKKTEVSMVAKKKSSKPSTNRLQVAGKKEIVKSKRKLLPSKSDQQVHANKCVIHLLFLLSHLAIPHQ